ncbi:MAG: hypothetical protein IPO37_17720 [Saprospiraceae bacterium]|nr:hypothetical protein [Saprospiraceae bacterium]
MNYEEIIAQKDAAIAQKDVKIQQQAARIEDLAHQIAQLQKSSSALKQKRFIPTGDHRQLNIFGELAGVSPDVDLPQEQNQSSKPAKRKSAQQGRQLLANCTHLPVEIRNVPVEHDESDIHLRDEISDRLAKRPGMLFIIRYIRPVYKKSRFRYHRHRTGHRRTYRQVRSRCKPAGRCSSVKVCRSYPRVSSATDI